MNEFMGADFPIMLCVVSSVLAFFCCFNAKNDNSRQSGFQLSTFLQYEHKHDI